MAGEKENPQCQVTPEALRYLSLLLLAFLAARPIAASSSSVNSASRAATRSLASGPPPFGSASRAVQQSRWSAAGDDGPGRTGT
jgi:hypothetical protein